MSALVYFSSQSQNTHRFIQRLALPARRIPLDDSQTLSVSEPFILVTPTYGGGSARGAVPRQVIRFLNNEHNRRWLCGVIASGNTNFGEAYGLAGQIIANKCAVPLLYRFELLGTPQDIDNVRKGVSKFWQQQKTSA